MKNKRVSVLVPTYNRVNYIEECLDSLLNQTVPPLELIVIDDGSTDCTGERLKRYGDRITYIRKENGGKPSALNLALPRARGDYVWLFDDDDVALPDAIEKRQALLDRRPDLGFVFSGHYLGRDGSDGRIERRELYEPACVSEDEIFLRLMSGCYFTLQSVLARKTALMAIGEFDESLVSSEDYDAMIRLATLFPCAGLYEPTFIFRQHDGTRGSQGNRYSEANRKSVFLTYDRAVGQKIRAALPLGHYLVPREDGLLEARVRRAALFSRMVVMASKGLIPEMLEDLALALQSSVPCEHLSVSERQQCLAAICTYYAFDAISSDWPAFHSGMANVVSLRGGREALRSLAFGFFRMAKSYPGSARMRWRRFVACCATMHVAMTW